MLDFSWSNSDFRNFEENINFFNFWCSIFGRVWKKRCFQIFSKWWNWTFRSLNNMFWTHTRLHNPIMTLQQLLKTFCEKWKFSCLFTLIHAQILYKLPQLNHIAYSLSKSTLLTFHKSVLVFSMSKYFCEACFFYHIQVWSTF